MEVWQSTDGIFLGQGKYAVDILKRFRMMDCKDMATPMALKLKLLCDNTSETVDDAFYRKMIVSIVYFMNNMIYIFFAVNTLRERETL